MVTIPTDRVGPTDLRPRLYLWQEDKAGIESGSGNILVFKGTAMAGTECASQFMSDDSKPLPFLEKLRRADGKLPHFEVVFVVNNMSGKAVKSSYPCVAYYALKASLLWRLMFQGLR
jgi:hypothetical protein